MRLPACRADFTTGQAVEYRGFAGTGASDKTDDQRPGLAGLDAPIGDGDIIEKRIQYRRRKDVALQTAGGLGYGFDCFNVLV